MIRMLVLSVSPGKGNHALTGWDVSKSMVNLFDGLENAGAAWKAGLSRTEGIGKDEIDTMYMYKYSSVTTETSICHSFGWQPLSIVKVPRRDWLQGHLPA